MFFGQVTIIHFLLFAPGTPNWNYTSARRTCQCHFLAVKPHGKAQQVSFITPPSIRRCRTKEIRRERILCGATDLVPATTAVIGQASGLSVAVPVVVRQTIA